MLCRIVELEPSLGTGTDIKLNEPCTFRLSVEFYRPLSGDCSAELWTNIPQEKEVDGWHSCPMKLVESDAPRGPSTHEFSVKMCPISEGTYEFTGRVRFSDGEVVWAGGFDNNGYVHIIPEESKLDTTPQKVRTRRENIISESIVPLHEHKIIDKPPSLRKNITRTLEHHFLFSTRQHEFGSLEDVVDAMVPREYAPGDNIVKEGDIAKEFSFIEKGRCHLIVGEKVVRVVGAGEVYGEFALFCDVPVKATLQAVEACVLWSVERSVCRRCFATTAHSEMSKRIEFLSGMELLSSVMTGQQIVKAATVMRSKKFRAGSKLVEEGQPGDDLFVIQSGKVKVTSFHRMPDMKDFGLAYLRGATPADETPKFSPAVTTRKTALDIEALDRHREGGGESKGSHPTLQRVPTSIRLDLELAKYADDDEEDDADRLSLQRYSNDSSSSYGSELMAEVEEQATADEAKSSKRPVPLPRPRPLNFRNEPPLGCPVEALGEEEEEEASTDSFGGELHSLSTTPVSMVSATEQAIAEYGPGRIVGEMALLSESLIRRATVTAVTDVRCLALGRDHFSEVFKPVVATLRLKMASRTFRTIPAVTKLPKDNFRLLCSEAELVHVQQGQVLVVQGKLSQFWYVVDYGLVQCTRKQNSTFCKHFGRGSTFGEKSIICKLPEQVTVTACSSVTAWKVPHRIFVQAFEPCMEELAALLHFPEVCISPLTSPRVLEGSSFDSPYLPGRREVSPPPVQSTYQLDQLQTIKTLGIGGYGKVYLVKHKPTGDALALKVLTKADVIAKRQKKNVITERRILQDIDCPFIVKLFAAFSDSKRLYMLQEFVQGGELWSLLYASQSPFMTNAFGGLPLGAVRFYCANLIVALEYLHDLNVMFRDIKPENLLIDTRGYVKVIDFGFAKYISSDNMKYWTLCGTPEYLSPEQVLGHGHDHAVDFWALGVLLFEMMCRRTPFQDNSQTGIFRRITRSHAFLRFPLHFPDDVRDLVKQLLDPVPAMRLGMREGGFAKLKQHAFFSGLDWFDLALQQCKAPFVPPVDSDFDSHLFSDRSGEDSERDSDGEATEEAKEEFPGF